MNDRIDVAGLVAGLDLPDLVSRYCELRPDGREYKACCPLHAENTPSFTLYQRQDKWRFKCFGCGAHGDGLDFLQEAEGVDRPTAIRMLGGDLPERRAPIAAPPKPAVLLRPILPVPADAPSINFREVWNPKRGRVTALNPVLSWRYVDASGALLGFVVRCQFEDGAKWTPTITFCEGPDGTRGWALVPFPAPRPLLGLQDLAGRAQAPVMVVEGEKAATAAARLLPGWVCVTWPGGGNGVKYADWSPLAGRDVVLWPDADDPGVAAAQAIGAALAGKASRVRVLDVTGQSKGWDAADALDEGWNSGRFVEWARARVRAWEAPADPVPPPAAAKPAPAPAKPALRVVGGADRPPPAPAPAPDPGEEIPAEYSDDNLALRYTSRYGAELRYVATWGRWYRWTGQVWQEDATHLAFDRARALCRAVASEVLERFDIQQTRREGIARGITSAKTIAAVIKLAQADRRHAAVVDQWDRDPWLLNTPRGMVDLHTGELRPHDPEAYCTKITAVGPGGDCPVWKAFLLRCMGGDATMVSFLQRVAGYALTGSTREHAMFFCYGTGGNGKGTFLNTLVRIMADYARVAPMETFAESKGERHPTELAMLRGARLVVAQETEEGQRWAESRIKALTGGDPITARFMRQDFFEFMPQFKLVIAGNHKPALRAPDEAIRRRLHLVPFDQTIAAEERDPDLAEKLWEEAPAILQWAIDGCLDYLERRIAAPERVSAATVDYLDDEDPLAGWIGECCLKAPSQRCPTADLYESYKGWSEKAGQGVWSRRRFTQNLEQRGFKTVRTGVGGRFIVGLTLGSSGATPAPKRDFWAD